MFRRKIRIKAVSIAVLILSIQSVLTLSAQEGVTGDAALKEQAMERFEEGAFETALSDYRTLMRRFPRDPVYRYYAGICMVELNRDLEEAEELLYYSSSRGVPEDVYYYLGEANRRLYDFEQAKKYFLEFDRRAPRNLTKELDSKLLIRSIDEARSITASYNPFEVLAVTFMDLKNPAEYEQIEMKGGKLTRKPENFFVDGEARKELTSLMFVPERVPRGDYVYFSGYERNRKHGSQIFRAKRGKAGTWTDLQTIDILCTDGDEILPYYDPVGKDIYFASDGMEGIGGFDLYRSHYDAERDEWGEPVNMGFPINSAFDDYLLLPGTDLGKVVIFSGRQSSDGSVAVYRVHLSEPKVTLASASPEEIARVANLDGVAAKALSDIESYRAMETAPEAKPVPKLAKKDAPDVDTEYRRYVADALKHQLVADSLAELVTDARLRIRESSDPNDRWLYQKQIMVWEKKAEDEQQKADTLYARISAYKERSVVPEVPETIEVDTVINDMTVYSYRETDPVGTYFNEKQDVQEQAEELPVGDEAAANEDRGSTPETEPREKTYPQQSTSAPLTDRFVMLDASPYSVSDPIPMDVEIPAGTFYRIQLGAFSKPVGPDTFGGLSPITGETLPGRGLIRYYVGKFSRYAEAERALTQVRGNGHPDAYLVSWYNGTKMSVDRVRKLEK